MTRQLIFVHGRSQQGLDSRALKQEWIEAWRSGLAKTGLSLPTADTDIHFPYFGDTLDQLSAGASADDAARVILRNEDLDRYTEEFCATG
jgi:hypothetical protein